MPLPGNFQTITVTGTYVDLAGAALNGSLRFDMQGADGLRDATANTIIIPESITATVSNGALSVILPATNDPDIAPAFTYEVTEDFPSINHTRTYTVEIPYNASSPLSITSIQP